MFEQAEEIEGSTNMEKSGKLDFSMRLLFDRAPGPWCCRDFGQTEPSHFVKGTFLRTTTTGVFSDHSSTKSIQSFTCFLYMKKCEYLSGLGGAAKFDLYRLKLDLYCEDTSEMALLRVFVADDQLPRPLLPVLSPPLQLGKGRLLVEREGETWWNTVFSRYIFQKMNLMIFVVATIKENHSKQVAKKTSKQKTEKLMFHLFSACFSCPVLISTVFQQLAGPVEVVDPKAVLTLEQMRLMDVPGTTCSVLCALTKRLPSSGATPVDEFGWVKS